VSKLGQLSLLFSGLSLAAFGVTRFFIREWYPFYWVMIGLIFIFLIAAVLFDRKFYAEFFSMKTTKHGMNMGVMILLVFALIFLINFIGARNIKTFDFSQAQRNTLSEQSIKLLNGLTEPLRVRFFYHEKQEGVEENRRAFRELIRKYQDNTNKISLEFVEVNERPDLAEEYGVKQGKGIVFLEYKGKKQSIEKIDEQDMTQALIRVMNDKSKKIYFIEGHGEFPLSDATSPKGLGRLKTVLESKNYQVLTLALSQTAKVPEDADAVAIVGAEQGLLEHEMKALSDYVKAGGNIVLGLEPKNKSGLDAWVRTFGLELQNDYLISIANSPLPKGITFAFQYSSTSEITKAFPKNQVALFFLPQSIKKAANAPASITYDELVKVGPAVALLDIKGPMPKNEGNFTSVYYAKGKLAAEDQKEFQLILFGDADVFANDLLDANMNKDLISNSFSQLAKDENLISISPKEITKTEIDPSQSKQALFYFGIIIPIPLLMLVSAILIWYRRRNA
jgi:ABC-type uncharacterized transport system involved in gliding motility auxiliary subunit